ncbi:TPA: hypothetical protein DCY68_01315 [Candidatus Azambacteria bacterium]|nr:hypothetical protein [Candidatus Azambacteria bacterium]HBA52421.1 hypothetical protein [Candidatus Azambacteria bacterium]HBC58900.1 hypothetical protein [Candidatus Azambacteria bacterium]HCB36272.1 hypothetical protein [Candidatus Azambacteria bacterium]
MCLKICIFCFPPFFNFIPYFRENRTTKRIVPAKSACATSNIAISDDIPAAKLINPPIDNPYR